jgi:hypothetical protein
LNKQNGIQNKFTDKSENINAFAREFDYKKDYESFVIKKNDYVLNNNKFQDNYMDK